MDLHAADREKLPLLVWTDFWPVYRDALAVRGLDRAVEFAGVEAGLVPPGDVLARTRCLLRNADPPPAGVLAAMPALEWVQAVTVGVDDWLSRPDLAPAVRIVCARGVHRIQMPENILGAIFHATKPFARAAARQAERVWDTNLVSQPIAGATLGIVGLGAIGTELARKAKLLEMRVVGANRRGTPVANVDVVYPVAALDAVLAEADFLVLLIPATEETENLIDRPQIARMKKGAWLLNFARGHVLRDEALLEGLASGHIAGAVLDAFRDEPLPPAHPFWNAPNVLVLPHMGGKHPNRNAIVAELFADNLERYLAGAPLNGVVERRKGY